MSEATKRLSRVESQARTRETILQAAEELFLVKGFGAATVAEIADRARRTQGSIYGNFANKEALCRAVLERYYLESFTKLAASVSQAGDGVDAQLKSIGQWWRALSSNQALTVLMLEFSFAVRGTAEQFASLNTTVELLRVVVRSTAATHVDVSADGMEELIDTAVKGIVSTGIGLALSQADALIDADDSATVLTETMRLWLDKIRTHSRHTAPHGEHRSART